MGGTILTIGGVSSQQSDRPRFVDQVRYKRRTRTNQK
jgi:hypothetical protein